METFFVTGFIALIAFNIYASRRSYRDVYSSLKQRWFQITFIWVVPFMGAALTLKILGGEPEKSSGQYQKTPELGDEFSGSGRLNSKGYISANGGNADSIGANDASPDT